VLAPWPGKVLIDQVLSGMPMSPSLRHVLSYLPGAETTDGLLAWCIGASVLLFLAGWMVGLAGTMAAISFGQRMVYDLAADLFAHLQRLSLRFHARRSVGDLLRRVTSDSGCISTITKDALLPVLTSLLSLGSMFLILWAIDPAMTLLALSIVPMMVLTFRRYADPMLTTSLAQHDAEGRVYEHVERTLAAIPVVQAFRREAASDGRLRQLNEAVLDCGLRATSVQLKFKTLMGLSTALGTALIVAVGAHRALAGSVTVGQILVFLSNLASLYGPLEALM
jgi:ABC-type multidrug transport system fused ATPase/permease subunit